MSLLIKRISKEEIASHKYVPDAHTVSLNDHGIWLGLFSNDALVSMLCYRVQRGEFYVGEIYTPIPYRHNGYATLLIKELVDNVLKGYSVSTHALITSKKCFERCGFKQYSFRKFKHGDQWWLRRDGKKINEST